MRHTRIAATLTALLLSALFVLTGANAAVAAGPDYVALGDSYSSGLGAGSYDSGSGDCKRSNASYPALWAAQNAPASFSFTACSGATTDDVVANQLGPVTSSTGLVSISVGGNDAGFADVMTACVLYDEQTCLARVEEAKAYMRDVLPGKLDNAYNAIDSRAPSAKVVVLGYPRLYMLDGECVAGLSETERAALNSASDLLNNVTSQRAAGHGYSFGNPTSAFTGHEICSGDSWIHSVSFPIGESYHPTAAGQSGGYLPVFASKA